MEQLVTTKKNGMSSAETLSLNPKNIIKYADNSTGYAELLYDTDGVAKEKPITYELSISKAALDIIVLRSNEIPTISASVADLVTGVLTATTFNADYVVSLKDSKAHIAGVLDASLIELVYSEGSFGSKRIFVDGAVSSISKTTPTYLASLSYAALLTQTSTGAPVATILEDTITGQVWARTGAGTYTLTKAGAYVVGKAIPTAVEEYYDGAGNRLVLTPTSVNAYTLQTYAAADTNTLADGVLSSQYFNIIIYR